MKLTWARPQLVSLYRGKPEENVLCGCKTAVTSGGPDYHNGSNCDKHASGHCDICQVGTQS
jgi:hypothetical protein